MGVCRQRHRIVEIMNTLRIYRTVRESGPCQEPPTTYRTDGYRVQEYSLLLRDKIGQNRYHNLKHLCLHATS
jgi:hypothetical protein